MKTLLLGAVLSIVSTALFADADLSLIPYTSEGTTFIAGVRRSVTFTVHNNGPDAAKDVVVTITATGADAIGPCATGCPIGDGTLRVGDSSASVALDLPDTPGDVIVTASVTSSTPDPNPGNSRASMTVHVSPNPEIDVRVVAPSRSDLALPFPLSVTVSNLSSIVAHDVNTTIDFRSDVAVKTLPFGCTNPAAGRVVCHSDEMSQGSVPAFVITLFAPPSYGSGFISFTVTTTEREPDFYPPSNTATASTQLWLTFYVTTTADSGAGSLRQAILDANASNGGPLTIAFKINEQSTTPWKTIRIASPLPAITGFGVRIDGGTQATFFGDANPDGPEIEISGGGTVDGDGLLVATCFADVSNLAIGGFLRNGLSLTTPQQSACSSFGYYSTQLHHLFIGTDPTGSSGRPNARGIGTSVPNGNDFNHAAGPISIHDCVISGNTFSGIFGMSGRLAITNNRIGVKAHADTALPNGASGVFIGTGGFGSDVGPDVFSAAHNPTIGGNVIAFNGETGVAIATGVQDVAVRNNRIWSNRLLGIDIGLNGPTPDAAGTVTPPVLTIARFDPASNKTIIDGAVSENVFGGIITLAVNIYASDAADPSGFGEGQRSLGIATLDTAPGAHFHFETDGNLTGQWITATSTRSFYIGFAKPEGIDQGFLTQTSEFSRGVPVQ
jgi:hypothetical protein